MKKIIKVFLMTLVILTACAKEEADFQDTIENDEKITVRFSYHTQEVNTRAFFENNTSGEPWETEVATLDLFIMGTSKPYFNLHKSLTSEEIESKEVKIGLPESQIGKSLYFYAVANKEIELPDEYGGLLGFIETDSPALYNGTFEEVTSRSLRPEGFVMSGYISTAKSSDGSITVVPIELSRVVNKIAIKTEIAPTFSEFYNGGVIEVRNVTISNRPPIAYLFKQHNRYLDDYSYSHSQIPGVINGDYCSLFYCYEGLSKATITLDCVFDEDGDLSTTSDQIPVSYTIPFNQGHKRNTYHRITATIKGLGGENVHTLFTGSEEWENSMDSNYILGL